MSTQTAIYVRQSINHAEGIDRQLDRTRKEAERRGWTVTAEYQDNDTSATKTRGPKTAWGRMLADAEAGSFTHVLAVDLDRLIRSQRDLITLIDAGLAVATISGEIDLSTADGAFRAQMLTAVAQFETTRKGERQKRANDFRVNNGLPVAGGRRRFGFESDHITPKPDEAAWVVTIYERIAAGDSLRSIARSMNEAGVKCVTKGLWNPPRIAKIAVNPAYRGMVIHHGQPFPSDKVPVIVKPELAETVAAVMADPSRRKTPGTERTALMGGLGECGACGAPLISAGTKSNGKPVKLYTCSAAKSGQTPDMKHPAIRRHIMDEAVTSALVVWLLEKDALGEEVAAGSNLAALIARGAEIARQRAVLTELALEPGADLVSIKKRQAALGRDAEKAAEAEAAERARMASDDVLSDFRAVFAEFIDDGPEDVEQAFHAHFTENLTLERQREIVRGALRVVLNPRGKEPRVQITRR